MKMGRKRDQMTDNRRG